LQVDPGDGTISWQHEIWPLQWKMAVMGVAGYLAFNLFTLVMFDGHGLVVAGQMGMTWTILTAIESAAYAWVQVRAPLFGMLAARQDWREMDRVFRRLMVISWSFYLLSIIGTCVGVWILNELPYTLTHRLASRLLGLEPTIVFAVAFLLLHLPRCQMIYVRAHKQDPFLRAGVVSHGLIALAVVFLGYAYGPIGAASGLLGVVSIVNVPWWFLIWSRFRRERNRLSAEQNE
jgi:cytochrome c oxidase subunit IV